MVSDLVMTAVLVYRFRSFETSITRYFSMLCIDIKRIDSINRTTNVIQRIVLYVVTRGILVTLAQAATLAINIAIPTVYSK